MSFWLRQISQPLRTGLPASPFRVWGFRGLGVSGLGVKGVQGFRAYMGCREAATMSSSTAEISFPRRGSTKVVSP